MWVTLSSLVGKVGKAKAFALHSKKARNPFTNSHQQGIWAKSHILCKEKYYYGIYCD